MATLRADQITVVWNNGQQKFDVIGGGLPRHAAWSQHDRLGDAVQAASDLADEMCLEIV